jgi:RNA polymerase sigma-70 factor (ECF subfamily)
MSDAGPQGGLTGMQDVIRQYEAPLVRYAARITGDADLARDVAQDVFLRLCRETSAELNGRLRPWLYTVCRNRAIEVKRKRDRLFTASAGAASGAAVHDDGGDAASYHDRRDSASDRNGVTGRKATLANVQRPSGVDRRDPALAVETAESTSKVMALLEELSPNQQDVIRLRFEHGLSYKEIAAVLELTVSNVGVLIHTGIKTLRQRME